MHAVTFTMKRAHLMSVAFGRTTVERVDGMTPARFDLLYVIRTAGYSDALGPFDVWMQRQDAIRKALGLSRATVSEMVDRLVVMGWVTKRRAYADRRTNVIMLTPVGLARIERAMRIVFQQRTHKRHFERLFKHHEPKAHPLVAIETFWSTAKLVAQSLADRSTLEYFFGQVDGEHEPIRPKTPRAVRLARQRARAEARRAAAASAAPAAVVTS